MHWFDLRTVPATPWKNGGGSTRELVCWPPGAGTDAFGWRVSVARIAAAGPFSAFAGVDRQIRHLPEDVVDIGVGIVGFALVGDDAAHGVEAGGRFQPPEILAVEAAGGVEQLGARLAQRAERMFQ